MTAPLANAARIVAELREKTKTEYGVQDGDEFLEGSLEGASELPEMLAMMARDVVQAEVYAKATQGQIQTMSERKARLEMRAEKLRGAIAWALSEAGWKKIPPDALPDMGAVTLSPGKPKLNDGDIEEVPGLFLRVKTVTEVNRALLKEWLEKGNEVKTWSLSNSAPVLTIRK